MSDICISLKIKLKQTWTKTMAKNWNSTISKNIAELVILNPCNVPAFHAVQLAAIYFGILLCKFRTLNHLRGLWDASFYIHLERANWKRKTQRKPTNKWMEPSEMERIREMASCIANSKGKFAIEMFVLFDILWFRWNCPRK